MAERGARVTGIDMSEDWIEMCREQYGHMENLEFLTADGSKMPLCTYAGLSNLGRWKEPPDP